MHYTAPLAVLFGLLAAGSAASGAAPISAPELLEHCRAYGDEPQSSAGLLCAAYVGGFVEGAGVLNSQHATAGDSSAESFTDRALRTRLGLSAPCQPVYCLYKSVSLAQFIADVLVYAEQNPPRRNMSANDVVVATLRNFHPCGPTPARNKR
jgi:hypothetical protein